MALFHAHKHEGTAVLKTVDENVRWYIFLEIKCLVLFKNHCTHLLGNL